MPRMISVIAITGGPCGGKSTLLAKAHQWLQEHDKHVVVVSETATELITAGLSFGVVGIENFQKAVLSYSIKREDMYTEMARTIPGDKDVVILCDRGLLDCIAYVGEEKFAEIVSAMGLKHNELRDRYRMVVHMVTAADGAQEYYTLANNAARSESPEEARALDQKTQHAWLRHPHHVIIDNSTDFDEKIRRTIRAFARVLNMPEPTETERKFLVKNFTPSMIPSHAIAIDIEQDYLVLSEIAFGERRVRKSTCDGQPSYYYTEKVETGSFGTRIERERQIDQGEYERLLEDRDPRLDTVKKTRYCFPYEGKRFELDVYTAGTPHKLGLVVLEVELESITETVLLPPDWEGEEVTGNPQYKNSTLAGLVVAASFLE